MKIKSCLLFFLVLIFIFFAKTPTLFAETPAEKYQKLQQEIDELSKKLTEAQNRAKTLSNQIVYMDNQIRLTVLKIQDTTEQIVKMGEEIKILAGRIGKLETSLTDISELLIDRVVATYKRNHVPFTFALLSADGFSDFISRAKYLALVQAHDKKLLYEVQTTKSDFEDQKKLLEDKKAELDLLQQKLEVQQVSLNQQKQDKEALLVVTRNDEKSYQKLLEEARNEQAAIHTAMKQAILQLKDGTPVDEGKEIAIMGNSGAPSCSTGAHLHFEVTKNGDRQNPTDYLKQNDVSWDNSPDSQFSFNGSWNWPMNNPIRLTQGYGMTYWARTGFYGGGPHTGIDMVSTNTVIKAPKSGTLYKGSSRCGSATLRWVAVEHGEGIISWYFHVQ